MGFLGAAVVGGWNLRMRTELKRDVVASSYTSKIARPRFSLITKYIPIFHIPICNNHPYFICVGTKRELGKISIGISFPSCEVPDGILRSQKSLVDSDWTSVIRDYRKCLYGVFWHFIIKSNHLESCLGFQQYGWSQSDIFYCPVTSGNLPVLQHPVLHGNEANEQPCALCGFCMLGLSEGRTCIVFSGSREAAEMLSVLSQAHRLKRDLAKSLPCIDDSKNPNSSEDKVDDQCSDVERIFFAGYHDPYIAVNVLLIFGLEGLAVSLLLDNRRSLGGWFLAACCLLCLIRLGVSLGREQHEERQREYRQSFQHDSVIVPQKHFTYSIFWDTVIKVGPMANALNTDKQIAVIGALAEGSSICAIERMTAVHRIPPVVSPETAVKAAILQEFRNAPTA